MAAAAGEPIVAAMEHTEDTGHYEHGRPLGDCPLCEYEGELDDVLVDVETWAEKTLVEIDAELRTH